MWKKVSNLLKTCYARSIMRIQPDSSKWVFSSVHNRAFNYNSSALFEYVKKYHPEIQAYYVMEDPVEREKLQELYGKESILDTSTMEGIRKVLECKVWFTSTAPPLYGIGFRKKYCVINLWHGVPLKKIGMEQENLSWLTKIYYKYLFADNYDTVVTTSEALVPVMSKSFLVEEERIGVWGQPRNDRLFQKQDVQKQMKQLFPGEIFPEFEHLLLYAPTFRDHGTTRLFPFSEFETAGSKRDAAIEKLQHFLEDNKSILCIRMHLYEDKGYEWLKVLDHPGSRVRFLNEDRAEDVMDVLASMDLLITDYSSIYIDYLLLERPIIFLPYDQEEYLKDRGFNFPYDEVTPGPKPKSYEEFLNSMGDLLYNRSDYVEKQKDINRKFNNIQEPCSEWICRQVKEKINIREK